MKNVSILESQLNKKIEDQDDISLDDLMDFTYENCANLSTNSIRSLFSRVNHKMGKNYDIDDAIKLWIRLQD